MGQGRLTRPDEYFRHQLPYTHDTVLYAHPDWRERVWVNLVDTRDRETQLSCGFGHYPNRNVQEAFACVRHGEEQRNVRMTRRLRPDQTSIRVGPFSYQVIEPFERIRLVMDDNPSGIGFDIELHFELRPHVEERHVEVKGATLTHDLLRYVQLGRASGTLAIPGASWTLATSSWYAARDHSWGLSPNPAARSPAGAHHIPLTGAYFTFSPFQFDAWGMFWYLTETHPRVPTYQSGSLMRRHDAADANDLVVAVEHDLHFVPGAPAQTLDHGTLRFRLAGGDERNIGIRAFRSRIFLRAGMYMGWKGWHQGMDRGEYYQEHDVWDHSDARKVRDEYSTARGGGDHVVEVSCGGEIGYGVMEYFVTPGYPRYREVQ